MNAIETRTITRIIRTNIGRVNPDWAQALEAAGRVSNIMERENPVDVGRSSLGLLETLRDYGWTFLNPFPLELLEQQLVLWGKEQLEQQIGVPLSAADPIDLSDAAELVPDYCAYTWSDGHKSADVWETLDSPDVDKYLKADIAVEYAKNEYGYNLSNY